MEALRTQPQSPSPSPLTGRMSSSDYPAPRRTARVRLPVLVRPAETHRQPPYLPSPLPSPRIYLLPFPRRRAAVQRLSCCGGVARPGGASRGGPRHQILAAAPGCQRTRRRGPACVRRLLPPGAGHPLPVWLRLLARGFHITSLDSHVVGARRLILALAMALVYCSVPATPPCQPLPRGCPGDLTGGACHQPPV